MLANQEWFITNDWWEKILVQSLRNRIHRGHFFAVTYKSSKTLIWISEVIPPCKRRADNNLGSRARQPGKFFQHFPRTRYTVKEVSEYHYVEFAQRSWQVFCISLQERYAIACEVRSKPNFSRCPKTPSRVKRREAVPLAFMRFATLITLFE